MKPKTLTALLSEVVVLTVAPNLFALPPRQHSVNGVIEAINCGSRTITLRSKDAAVPVTFVWNDSTRFTKKGGCAKCGFDSGQMVRVSYRTEVGQHVLREVSPKGSCAGCGVVSSKAS